MSWPAADNLEGRDHIMETAFPQTISWSTLPELPLLTGSTIPEIGRRFFIYSPSISLKLGTDDSEAFMTSLAYNVLGSVVPYPSAIVSISSPSAVQGILLTRQPGTPLVELWPTLTPAQCTTVKESLSMLLVRMRASSGHFDYYGRPGEQPYITQSEFGPDNIHDYCHTRSDWDLSRVHALRTAAVELELSENTLQALERVQQETGVGGAPLVDRPVLTHGDLSDRNILVDPSTLAVAGLIDWELSNVAPAYFEYALARLSGGHDPEWRKELLDVLRDVLRIECERAITQNQSAETLQSSREQSERLATETLAAWKAFVDVERPAQGYSDDCYWTFEDDPHTTAET